MTQGTASGASERSISSRESTFPAPVTADEQPTRTSSSGGCGTEEFDALAIQTLGLVDDDDALTVGEDVDELGSCFKAVAVSRGRAREGREQRVATRRIVGRLGKDSQHASMLGELVSASSTAKVLPVPASPCTTPMAPAANRAATARRA